MSIDLTMPRLSDTMEAGTILKWNASEGDAVSAGDVVADIETDKATMEMQVFDDGVLAKIVIPEGQQVPVGTTIAVLAEEDEDAAAVAASTAAPAAATAADASGAAGGAVAAPPAPPAVAVPSAPAPSVPASSGVPVGTGNGAGPRLRVSPVARRLADEHGLDVRRLTGSGPNGRVVKDDVLSALAGGGAPTAAAGAAPGATMAPAAPLETGVAALADETIALSSMRQTIARRMVESKTTVPHYQVTMRFDMDPLLDLRRTLNEQLESHGVKLSVNDFVVRACALAMHEHPEFNASWTDGSAIQVHGRVNVGVAIALPRERGGGLVVGVINDADRKGLRQISHEAKALGEKARGRGLGPEDMSGATFTISNLGMFGVDHFTAIVNTPNSAILAVGGAIEQPVVRDGAIVVGHEMSATLSLDHRVIDGAMAARYLQTLRSLIEQPASLLV